MPVTRAELTTRLTAVVPQWSEASWGAFLDATPEEAALMLQILQDSAEPPPTDAWVVVLEILQGAVSVAGAVTGIAGAIGAVQAVVKLA